VIAALSEDHRVFAVDTIGDAGRSTQTSRIRDGRDLALWMVDVLDALALDRVHLVGLSYGGWLALNQAHRATDRLASVTAADPPGALGRPRGSFVIRILPDSILASVAKSDRALHRLLRLLNNGTLPTQPLLELSVAGLRTFRAKLPYPKRMADDVLRTIDTPTLLLFCERSPVNNARRAMERSRHLVANVETGVVPGAGHMLPVEMPQFFASRVIDFVDTVDRGSRPAGQEDA
jgi:pimeloyl-ACP methyl ester carboxylesterase